MKILGIDYGTKRIGLAISDETANFARELEIFSPRDFWGRIGEIIKSEDIHKVVVGLPLGVEGNDTEKTTEVREFSKRLSSLVEVDFMDERFSSTMAHNLPGGRGKTDSLAAQIILQNYLDRQKNSTRYEQ